MKESSPARPGMPVADGKAPMKTLPEMMRYLNLLHSALHYETMIKQAADDNLSHEAFLERLLSEETSAKFSRTVALRLKQARLPGIKTLDTYDFAHPHFIPKHKILSAFSLSFVEKKEGLIFMGPSGLGKTHLAIALGYKACEQGVRVLFTRAVDMINHLIASQSDHTLHRVMKIYTWPTLLIIDEVGHLPFDQKGGEHFFNVISHRYERGSVILTTNRPFKDWGKIFHDTTLASGIIDRLVHHTEVVKIEGESYRVKDRKTRGLILKN